MPETRLKTAILGLDDNGRLLLEAASQLDYFHIEAVADKDITTAEEVANEHNCIAYDDYRQLITQNQFDCLIVAAGIYSCDEYIRAAMKKKFDILKLAPPARNFQEAAEFVRLADEENVTFAVGNPYRFAESFLALKEFLAEPENNKEQFFLVRAFHSTGEQLQPAWHNDPKLAGGGVLLRNCYGLMDQLTCNFAMPEQVYSLTMNVAGDRQQRHCLTEDAIVVSIRFSDNLICNLIASRRVEPKGQSLKIYGKDKIISVTDSSFAVSNRAGKILQLTEYKDNPLGRMKKLLENFALSILSPDNNRPCSSARENLRNMAVIESAYLSSRTDTPEQPGRIPGLVSSR